MSSEVRILYVGSQELSREAREAIRRDQARLSHEETSASARDRLSSDAFDVVVAEAELPDGSGLEVLSPVADEDGPDTVLIDEDGYRKRLHSALDAGVGEYVGLTPTPETFERLFTRVLSREEDEEPATTDTPEAPLFHDRSLESQKEFTENVLDAFPDVTYVVDEDGQLQDWNRSVPEITGYDEDELGTMHALEFFPLSERGKIGEAIETTLEEGRERVEALLETQSGEQIPYEFHSARTQDPKGRPVIVGVGRDVTQRREREGRLERQRRQLALLNRLVGHDIRQDMTVLREEIASLDDLAPEDLEEPLGALASTVEHALELTDRTQELVALVTAGGQLATEPTALAPLVEAEVEQAQRGSPEAELVLERPIPEVEVEANPLLAGVIRHLLTEVSFHDHGSGTVTVGADVREGEALVEVHAEGDRAEEDERPAGGGAGPTPSGDPDVGIELVRNIVDEFGGTVDRNGAETGETRIQIALPLA